MQVYIIHVHHQHHWSGQDLVSVLKNWVHCMKFRPSLAPTELFERERCPLIALDDKVSP